MPAEKLLVTDKFPEKELFWSLDFTEKRAKEVFFT
jgi:hypothetical protein